jgi:hypothetical protein
MGRAIIALGGIIGISAFSYSEIPLVERRK